MDEQKENKPKKLDSKAIEILRDNLFEPEPKDKWIEEQADGEQQKKEWKKRERDSKKQEVKPMRKLNHPLQAYSMRMGEIEPLEDMMWSILERIGFVPTYHANTAKQVSFELGKIYNEFITKLREYMENKGKDVAPDKILLSITGPPISGKSYILELIKDFLKVRHGFEVQGVVGKNIDTEHSLMIKPSENVRK